LFAFAFAAKVAVHCNQGRNATEENVIVVLIRIWVDWLGNSGIGWARNRFNDDIAVVVKFISA